jgi:hypothetical protein
LARHHLPPVLCVVISCIEVSIVKFHVAFSNLLTFGNPYSG